MRNRSATSQDTDRPAVEAKLPPGPRLPVFAQTWLLRTRTAAFLRRCRSRYGDTFTVRDAVGGPMVFLSDPDDIRAVFSGNVEMFRAGAGNLVLKPILGNRSVLLLDGTEHRDRRRVMLPAFHGQQVRRQEPLVRAVVRDQLTGWPVGRPFAAHERTRALALEIILSVVLGVREPDRTARLRAMLPRVVDLRPADLLMIALPRLRRYGRWRRYWEHKARVDALLGDEIALRAKARELAEREDVLSALLRAYLEAGDPIDDGELREQLLTLLLAGHETTATALAWAFDLLAHDKQVQDRLAASVAAGESDYAAAVVTETLRIRPVIDFVARWVGQPVRVREQSFPAGVTLCPAITLVQDDPALHPDPDRFRPERWLGDAAGRQGMVLPFGGGPRRCLGAPFAVTELRVALEEVIRAYRISPVSRRPERVRMRHITSVPARGARVVLNRR